MLVRTVLVGGACFLIDGDAVVSSREGTVLRDRRRGVGAALALVPFHLWLCKINCTVGGVRSWCGSVCLQRLSAGPLRGIVCCLVLHQAGQFIRTGRLTGDTAGCGTICTDSSTDR